MKPLLLFGVFICAHFLAAFDAHADDAPPSATGDAPVLTAGQFDAERAAIELSREKTNAMLGRVMPFVGMGFTVLILLIIFGFVHKLDANRHQTIRTYLELGKEVPPQLLADSNNPANWDPNRKPASDRRKGIIWTAVGIGLGLALWTISGGSHRAAALGLIPLFVGLAYLVLAALDRRSAASR